MADAGVAPCDADDELELLYSRLARCEAALAAAETQRANERAARIRVQRQLRHTSLVAEEQAAAAGEGVTLRARAIGTVSSCFSRRNGTPRQPGLVSCARAVLALRQGVPHDCLTGLEAFSHCWVLYVFHQNTDLHVAQQQQPAGGGGAAAARPQGQRIKSRVAVPRLDGDTRGVFATRTPHRPVPVGLSLGRLRLVDAARGLVHFEGLDLVDGTPVLDIKPFVPFCDAPPPGDAVFAPDWVAPVAHGDPSQEPLRIASVTVSPAAAPALWSAYTEAEAQRRAAWAARHRAQDGSVSPPAPPALYDTAAEFTALVTEVLSRDIRALRHRMGVPDKKLDVYRVILCCVEVGYTLDEATRDVVVVDAKTALPEDDWAAAQDAAAAEAHLSDDDVDTPQESA